MNEENKEMSIDNLKRGYFKPASTDEEKAKVQTAIETAVSIASHNNIPVNFNWKAEQGETLPQGYAVSIIPIPQRREGVGNVIIGLHIAGIPSPELIMESEKGQKWAMDTLVKGLINRYSNAVRPRENQIGEPTAPFSIDDFTTNQTRESGLAFFREIQSDWVKGLKSKGLKLMTPQLLKQVLSSKQFAEQTFPSVSQQVWENVLDKMAAQAVEADAEAGVIAQWRESRDNVTFDNKSLDLDDLDDLIGGDDADEVAAA